jgi:hypothetical protein
MDDFAMRLAQRLNRLIASTVFPSFHLEDAAGAFFLCTFQQAFARAGPFTWQKEGINDEFTPPRQGPGADHLSGRV